MTTSPADLLELGERVAKLAAEARALRDHRVGHLLAGFSEEMEKINNSSQMVLVSLDRDLGKTLRETRRFDDLDRKEPMGGDAV